MKKILLSTVVLLSLVASLPANNPVSAQESSSQATSPVPKVHIKKD